MARSPDKVQKKSRKEETRKLKKTLKNEKIKIKIIEKAGCKSVDGDDDHV
jgi:hypothetical protein